MKEANYQENGKAASLPDDAVDIEVRHEASLFVFTPLTRAALEHLAESVAEETTWIGGGLAVEHRFAQELVEALEGAGFKVELN